MLRKRKQPTPHFKLPSPFQPITGERAKLLVPGFNPYCAMMQVAAEDTHQDYVLCRGFDVRIARFIDYDVADLANSPGIPVAKPFSNRGTGLFELAHIFPAFLPLQTANPSPAAVLWRVGQNPGVSVTTVGQPADLNEEVEILYTDEGVAINWMMVDSGSAWYIGKMTEAIAPGETKTAVMHSQGWVSTGIEFEVYNPHDVTLKSGLKVRWTKYPKWDGWIVEPWHFVKCP